MNTTECQLSIVIVSYKAPAFLKLTLYAVQKALASVSAEVLLVDNSPGSSIEKMVAKNFPFVKVIANNQNLGFGKANNLAIKEAKGKIALLLNPDTIIPEDCFSKLIQYYEEHPEAGGVGVKMIDGAGNYLKESKRGFPGVKTSFFKLSGLIKLAPNSERFANYYHGHLCANQNHKIDILSGAFLAMPRQSNGQFLLFDERYFMYGEDIDLSHRLKQNFGENHYLAELPIIHFKGKTTPRNSFILGHFYHSMWLFYKQHLLNNNKALTNFIVWLSILSICSIKKILLKFRNLFKGSEKMQAPTQLLLVTSDTELRDKLQSKYPYTTIKQYDQAVGIYSNDSATVIFDTSNVTSQQIIHFLRTHPAASYGYITLDGAELIISNQENGKGFVIKL